jgi:hypothetical protein
LYSDPLQRLEQIQHENAPPLASVARPGGDEKPTTLHHPVADEAASAPGRQTLNRPRNKAFQNRSQQRVALAGLAGDSQFAGPPRLLIVL